MLHVLARERLLALLRKQIVIIGWDDRRVTAQRAFDPPCPLLGEIKRFHNSCNGSSRIKFDSKILLYAIFSLLRIIKSLKLCNKCLLIHDRRYLSSKKFTFNNIWYKYKFNSNKLNFQDPKLTRNKFLNWKRSKFQKVSVRKKIKNKDS